MKTLLVLLLLSGVVQGQTIRDEQLSQKYENLILDGEDKDIIEDQMTSEGVTPEDLELSTEMEGEDE